MTLRQLVTLSSAVILVLSGLALYIITGDVGLAAGVALLVAFITYAVTIYLLRVYVHRRIRTMYKFILPTKDATPTLENIDAQLRTKTLAEVELDVANWSNTRNEELKTLKENIDYRKEFLQNLSHELKTPIFSIQGYIETLEEGAIDNKEVATKFLNSASKGVQRLVSLTESIDSIAKLESKQVRLNKTSFVPYELIEDVYHEMHLDAEKNQIELKLPPKNTEKLSAVADQAQIRQVLINLVHNAVKYCGPGNTISAQIHRVDSDTLLVEITDDGPGIDEEHVARVFERFYRTDSSRSRHIGGTGLGLAISKHIVEAHDQAITCRSKLDEGTTFGFTLARV